jgi:ribosomal protein S18 acetylase RimI-like enzyme
MNLTYEKASAKDIAILVDIEKGIIGSGMTYSTIQEVDEWVLEAIKAGPVYIIKKDQTVVGNVAYEIKSPTHACITSITVLPEFQRQGIAREVMEHILNEIGNVERIDLVTHPDNFKAINLYKSLGFTIESKKENYYGDGEPRVVMSLLSK